MLNKLPSQRELLTTLVHSLCETQHDDGGTATTAANARPSERLSSPSTETWDSPQRRKLILTLHVIFPGMLLPALDLLDRNLVRRLTLNAAVPEKRGQEGLSHSPPSPQSGSDGAATDSSLTGRHAVYTVRSLASTLPSRRGATGPPPSAATAARVYLVHLEAWSCSCADFAVDAYAATANGEMDEHGQDDDPVPETCKFGGMSRTGVDVYGAGNVPCCKHLLACLLADEWEQMLATHVEDRACTKEELAGIIASI